MALQMSLLRRGSVTSGGMMKSASHRLGGTNGLGLWSQQSSPALGAASNAILRRNFAVDAGDVIGIDLGTTNSCVAIMVSACIFPVTYC